jgi:hypothetical protein
LIDQILKCKIIACELIIYLNFLPIWFHQKLLAILKKVDFSSSKYKRYFYFMLVLVPNSICLILKFDFKLLADLLSVSSNFKLPSSHQHKKWNDRWDNFFKYLMNSQYPSIKLKERSLIKFLKFKEWQFLFLKIFSRQLLFQYPPKLKSSSTFDYSLWFFIKFFHSKTFNSSFIKNFFIYSLSFFNTSMF